MATTIDRTMSGWIAWYETDRFDSQTTDLKDLPVDGCLGILTYYSDGRSINHSGVDWYFYDDLAEEIWSTYGSKAELLARYPKATKIIRGKWTDATRFAQVIREMETLRLTPRPY